MLTIHEVQNEAELVRGVEGIGHTDYKRTVLQGKSKEVHLGQKAKCDLGKLKIHLVFFLCYLPVFPSSLLKSSFIGNPCPPVRALLR